MPSERIADFVNELLRKVPELTTVYDEHIDDNDELLPHVFLGEVTRSVIKQVDLETGVVDPVATRILDHLESYASNDCDRVRELVSVSFLENLLKCDEVVSALRPFLGPTLTRELDAF